MNELFMVVVDKGAVDEKEAIREINALIKWQMARKRWHQSKTQQKMAAEADDGVTMFGNAFKSSDFGLNEVRCSFRFPFPNLLHITNK